MNALTRDLFAIAKFLLIKALSEEWMRDTALSNIINEISCFHSMDYILVAPVSFAYICFMLFFTFTDSLCSFPLCRVKF